MGYLTSNHNVDQPARRRDVAPKSSAAFTSDKAKAANKKTFTRLGKGLAYNGFVADRTGANPRS